MSGTTQNDRFTALFNIFDTTGDGNIKEEDFAKAFAPISDALASYNAEAAEKFNKSLRRCYLSLKVFADTDKDKAVNQEEWLAWANGFAADLKENNTITKNYHHFTDAIFTSISPELDENDGELNRREITSKEYAEWFSLMNLNGSASEIFTAMDTNGKDSITKDEFEAALMAFFSGDENAPQVFGEL